MPTPEYSHDNFERTSFFVCDKTITIMVIYLNLSADTKRAPILSNFVERRMYRRDSPIDHVLCVTNSLELGEIAFRSTLTNNVRPLTRDLSRFRDDHNLPIL